MMMTTIDFLKTVKNLTPSVYEVRNKIETVYEDDLETILKIKASVYMRGELIGYIYQTKDEGFYNSYCQDYEYSERFLSLFNCILDLLQQHTDMMSNLELDD